MWGFESFRKISHKQLLYLVNITNLYTRCIFNFCNSVSCFSCFHGLMEVLRISIAIDKPLFPCHFPLIFLVKEAHFFSLFSESVMSVV